MRRRSDDRGTVLPLVLVFVVVLGFVVAGLSRYAATNLRYSTVVRDRTAASASAEAGLRYAIERVRTNSVTTCDNGPVRVAPTNTVTFNDTTPEITCDRLDGGQATLAGWAAVITGVGIGSQEGLQIDETGDTVSTGRVYVDTPRSSGIEVNGGGHVHFHDGDVFYDGSADDCGTIEQYGVGSYADWDANDASLVCWPQTWSDVVDEPPVPTLAGLPTDPPWSTVGSCRVFEPGRYTSLDLDVGGDNYFRSGVYLFDNALIDTAGASATPDTNILAGYPHDARFQNRLITSGACSAAQAADGIDAGPHGVTWYFGGSSRIIIRRHTTMELLPMLHDDGVREHAVSIHVLGPGSIKPETLGDLVQVIDDQDNTSYPYSDVLFQGQIWSPTQPVDLEDSLGDPATGQVTSGVVAAQILVESTNAVSGVLGPDLTPADHLLLLSSVATVEDVTVEARAVVEYRPNAVVVDDRVAVRSIRFVD